MAEISYIKTNWVNNVTKLNADNMNHIENGIEAATVEINTLNGNLANKASIDYVDNAIASSAVSPTVETEAITGGTKVTITDKDGAHEFDVMNGVNGTNGKSAYASAQDGGFTGTETQFNKGLSVMGQVDGVEDTDALGIDTTVTQNSGNLITSGAVYSYIQSHNIDIPDIPDYVKAEAEATIAKSFSHGNLGRTIRFIATSDSHEDSNNMSTANPNISIGNKHCGQAIKYIADRIGLDFIAFLGDATWAGTADLASAYSQSMLIQDIEQFNGFISDGYKGIPNIRIVGNHDQLYTTKDTPGSLCNSGAYDLFGRYCNGIKNIPAGYGYLDLESAKVRVIYLNTSDIPVATEGAYLSMTQEQLNWLAETLLASGDKAGWKILILSHAPLDLINKSDVLTAYVNGTTYGSYNFANHNSAQLLANVHGHIHCYSYGYIGDKIRRFCIPNSNFQDNNHYKNNASYAQWSDTVTYPKTANSGKDTAFSLVTIDLDNNMCYVDNYGAGIDREFSCDYNTTTPPTPTALLNLNRDYIAGTTGESIGNHLDESKAYTNLYYGDFKFTDPACTQSDVSENSVTVKESGAGGISIAYPVHLPDLATHDYTLSFDYSGAGKQRAYYKLCTDAGAMGSITTITDETAGSSGTKTSTISAGGEAYTWLIVMFSSNTGNTKSYTNVKLEKAN